MLLPRYSQANVCEDGAVSALSARSAAFRFTRVDGFDG
jgi:hypothetical protein